MTTIQQEIALNVFVNKAKNCVAFVESDLDFVDVLLSFLMLPVGTVVRLLNKQSSLGCLDKLYQGVEQLDEKYLATAACRSMLTNPVNSSGAKCQKLKINIDETGEFYTCTSELCSYNAFSYYSSLKCNCGREMLKAIRYNPNQDNVKCDNLRGVFIKGAKFIVTDSLSVASIEHAMSSFVGCYGDWSGLEKISIRIQRAQVLHILKRSLVSDTPLTDVLLHNGESEDISPKFSVPSSVKKTFEAYDKEEEYFRIKLALSGNKVLYAEVGQDFVDAIFSILTFPLGALKKNLGNRFEIACLDNLYVCAERLASSGYVVRDCKERLLNPKLPPYFHCVDHAIDVEFEEENVYYTCNYRCGLTTTEYHCSYHGHSRRQAELLDPIPRRNFCKNLTYMVSDELVVTPFSFTSAFSLHRKSSEPVKMADLGFVFERIFDLLDAALSSTTVLTDVFFDRANAMIGLFDEKGE